MFSQLKSAFLQSAVFSTGRTLVAAFPLTLQGLITLTLTAFVLSVYGYGAMDLVVFSLTICALTIIIFSLFCAVFSGMIIQRRVRKILNDASLDTKRSVKTAIHAEAGYPNETGFTVPTPSFLPLVKLSWEIVYPDHLSTRVRVSNDTQLTEEIIPDKRCRVDEVIRVFTVSDVLGFCRYSWRQAQDTSITVLPRSNTLKSLPLLRSLTAEDGIPNPSGNPDGDRMEIRPYVAGDSVRNILWKVYARNRQLNVRLAEKSVFHSRRTIAYLLSSPNDEAAAAVARSALESGALGDDWAFSADGSEVPCSNIASALEAVAKSRAIGPAHAYGLDHFISASATQSGAHCIIFAAAELAPWLAPLRNTISRYNGHISVVLATDGLEEPVAPARWQRWFLRDSAKSATPHAASGSRRDLLKLLTDLGQLVESALVVDRKTGFSFDQNLRKV